MTDVPAAPPRHLVVLGHPSPDSFNGAVAEAYCAEARDCGQVATLRDLYAIGFDPRLSLAESRAGAADPPPDVAAELELVRASDIIVLVYPIWFGMPPAIVKGYVDRVLGNGFGGAGIRTGRAHPLLAGKRLLTLSSSATTRPWLEAQGQWEGLRQAFDRYLVAIFGMHSGTHLHFDAVVEGLDERFVRENLEQTRIAARRICGEIAQERHGRRARKAVLQRTLAVTSVA
jgi:NAD(P)H dehydrogenase (quinone)